MTTIERANNRSTVGEKEYGNSTSRRGVGGMTTAAALERPQSRQAWIDTADGHRELYEGMDPKTPPDIPIVFGNDTMDTPVAMESEVFEKDGSVRIYQRHKEKVEDPKGCWYQFRRGIRSIWMTKQTEDTAHDKELYVKTTLRELVIYLLFLIDLCILTFGMTSTNMFYFTQAMNSLFLDEPIAADSNFRTMSEMDDFWAYAKGPLLKGLYWERWYNGRNASAEGDGGDTGGAGYVYFENKLLGLPRLRMLKVKGDSCQVPDSFKREIKQCYRSYDESAEDRNSFGLADSSAWVYNYNAQTGSQPYWGQISTYGGGGFTQNLAHTQQDSLAIINHLEKNLWIDRGTRVIIIDFTVYNANVNLFCVVKLVLEFPSVGGVITSWSFRTVKLIRYVTMFDYVVLGCEGVFCAFILYYIVEEILEVCKHRCGYFVSFWNLLDIIVILISLGCIGFSVYRAMVIDDMLATLLAKTDTFADFDFLSFAQTRFNEAVAVLIFVAWIKIFKYISFNKTMNQLSSTLSRCAKDVGGFAIMFFIFFFAYAQLGYLLFGTQVQDFSSFYDSVFSLLRIILGDFNFHDLERANRILGPIFFITYVFFVFFVLLNMFLAIINDTYAEVKAELANQKNEFEIADFFKRGYANVMRKINLKKDHIQDVQQAMHQADKNHDRQVDYHEWRQELKMRGYTEQEIEAMFARYDLDGDRVLDENEQRFADADFDQKKLQLGRAVNEIDTYANQSMMGPNMGRGGGGGGTVGVHVEEFNLLSRRVDRIEHSIGSVVTKIDSVLIKLESMEKTKSRQQEELNKLINRQHTKQPPNASNIHDDLIDDMGRRKSSVPHQFDHDHDHNHGKTDSGRFSAKGQRY